MKSRGSVFVKYTNGKLIRRILRSVAKALEAERAARGISRTAFAKSIKMPTGVYFKLLRGRGNPTLLTLTALANTLGWSHSQFRDVVENGEVHKGRRKVHSRDRPRGPITPSPSSHPSFHDSDDCFQRPSGCGD